jgi:SAM-dependent methyltransferase
MPCLPPGALVDVQRLERADSYRDVLRSPAFAVRRLLERHLAARHAAARRFALAGFCASCLSVVDFEASFAGAWRAPDGLLVPNWREYLRCPQCGMNGRQRMIAQAIAHWAESSPRLPGTTAYMMEQVSPLYRWATAAISRVRWVGSEYLGPHHAAGSRDGGVRHEDAEALGFADATFDLVVSCDVLEHVSDPVAAFAEIARVLRPGGVALLTIPIDPALARNRRRALREPGGVRHLLPEIYHGDPLSARGALVFTDFGWEVLAQLRAAGLAEVALHLYWSYALGYLGIQFYLAGRKAAGARGRRDVSPRAP